MFIIVLDSTPVCVRMNPNTPRDDENNVEDFGWNWGGPVGVGGLMVLSYLLVGGVGPGNSQVPTSAQPLKGHSTPGLSFGSRV